MVVDKGFFDSLVQGKIKEGINLFIGAACFTDIYVPSSSIIQFETEIIKGALKRLYEFVEQHFKEFPATQTAVMPGDATALIINYIEEHHIDLVIMGTHGRKGMEKIFFGSVADRVVKTSPVPVMVVNPYK